MNDQLTERLRGRYNGQLESCAITVSPPDIGSLVGAGVGYDLARRLYADLALVLSEEFLRWDLVIEFDVSDRLHYHGCVRFKKGLSREKRLGAWQRLAKLCFVHNGGIPGLKWITYMLKDTVKTAVRIPRPYIFSTKDKPCFPPVIYERPVVIPQTAVPNILLDIRALDNIKADAEEIQEAIRWLNEL